MKIIGITGGTGSGKTTALYALESLNAWIIDADTVYHDLTVRNFSLRKELEARFGEVYEADGSLNRKKLGAIVFQDAKALEALNDITHRYVGQEIDRQIQVADREGKPIVAIDAIELIGSGLGKKCHVTVAVSAPAQVRIKRIMARENITEEYARMRVAAQKDEAYFRENCDHVLENGEIETPESFAVLALAFFKEILEETN